MRILLVDDSATMRKIVLRSLNEAGFRPEEVLEAKNGVEALELLKAGPVDLVLSDVNMPEMSGLDLLKEIKANEALRAMPVVMVTSESSPAIIDGLLGAGAAGHIQKPFTPARIKAVIGPLAA